MDQRPDMQLLARQVLDLLLDELATTGVELLDVRMFQGGGRIQVRIYVDTEDGINLAECTSAARTCGMLLEEADLFPGQYVVEVSSPGIRRPLRTLKHFQASVGQKVAFKLYGSDLPRGLKGVLTSIEDKMLLVQPALKDTDEEEPAIISVPLHRVVEANLDLDFDAQSLINADRRRRKEEKREKRKAERSVKRCRPRKRPGDVDTKEEDTKKEDSK